jgi:hypothetical protein
MNSMIFGKKLLNKNCLFWSYLQSLFETFLILRRIQRDIDINVRTSSCKVPIILTGFQLNLNFLYRFSKKAQISNLNKIRPVAAEMFHEYRQMDGWMDMMKLTAFFCNSADVPKTVPSWSDYNYLFTKEN